MAIVNAAGTKLTKTQLLALTTEVEQDPIVKFTADIWETSQFPGAKSFEDGANVKRQKLFIEGQEVRQSVIDAAYAASVATFGSILPVTGAAAGGTPVVIKGTGFAGVRGVTLGAVACTALKVISDTEIHCTTGPHAAGAVALVIQDASGDVNQAAAYTYA